MSATVSLSDAAAADAAVSGASGPPIAGAAPTSGCFIEVDCGDFVLQADAHTEANRAVWLRELAAWGAARKRTLDASLLISKNL
jgi:hypothetical protein